MTTRILFVDDEPNVLSGFKRILRRAYEFDTAIGGHEGLELMAEHEYAVIVSDMRMPEMSGEEFLAKAYQVQPDAIQIILSGQANLDATVAAVNDGNIFKFLVKPVSNDALTGALDRALEQFRLLRAEKELLEQTLAGAVSALTQVLALVSPGASRRTGQIVEIVERVAPVRDLADDWQLRLAAMLSGVGYAAVPPDVIERSIVGDSISDAEAAMLARHPDVTARLLGSIPRLEGVADIIRAQHGAIPAPDGLEAHVEVLAFATVVAEKLLHGAGLGAVLDLLAQSTTHDPALVGALRDGTKADAGAVVKELDLNQLLIEMLLRQDVHTTADVLLASEGTRLTESLLERLRNYGESVGVRTPILVEYTKKDTYVS